MACQGVPFEGYIAWPYLDFGTLGTEKQMEGLDLVCTGEVSISIGYNQKDPSQATPGYVVDGDTLGNMGMIPFPITAPSLQLRLTFSYGQFWEWSAMNIYLIPSGGDT